jgi:hypothetical protein
MPQVSRDEQWAINQFRPLLNEIDLSEVLPLAR